MKIPKYLILLSFFIFITHTTSQFYITSSLGYGFLPISSVQQYNILSDTSFHSINSYGMGIRYSVGLGYIITKNISFELNGIYLIGSKYQYIYSTGSSNTQGKGLFVSPSIRIQTVIKNIIPYSRLGVLIGWPEIEEEYTSNRFSGSYKLVQRGGVAIGLDAGLGTDIILSKKLNVFIELFCQSINWNPNEKQNIQTYSGFMIDPPVIYNDSNRPSKAFGTFGGKVGICYFFGKAPKK
jgi:hypothetical protein